MSIFAQLIHSITSLGRWARLIGPGKPVVPKPAAAIRTPVTVPFKDPSSQEQTPCSYTSAPGTTATVADCQDSTATPEADPSPLASLKLSDATDPGIPAAVTALREQLRSQPDLLLDIPGILMAIGEQFQKANEELMAGSDAEVSMVRGTSIWDLSAKKLMITRVKLERWAEIIAAGGAQTCPAPNPPEDMAIGQPVLGAGGGNQDGESESVRSGATLTGLPGAYGDNACDLSGTGMPMQWQCNNLWGGNDLFGALEPSMWFDAPIDWNALPLNQAFVPFG